MIDFYINNIKIKEKGDTMTTRLNGTSLFSGITTGLSSTYSLLASQNSTGGVTLVDITSGRSNTSLTASLNQNFASYMQTNFSTLDADGDGNLSATEISDLSNKISTQGLTQAQLTQLGTASGLSTDTLEQVLEHFSDVDANKDGKVTAAEISAYGVTAEADKKKTEYANKKATDMSIFYGSETSSNDVDSTSMLDYKYLKDENS